MAYLNDLNKSTVSNKSLREKEFKIAKIQKMTEIKKILLQWFINFSIKKIQMEQLKMRIFPTKN